MRTLLVAPALHSVHGGIPRILRLYQRALLDRAIPGDELDVLVLNDGPGEKLTAERGAPEVAALERRESVEPGSRRAVPAAPLAGARSHPGSATPPPENHLPPETANPAFLSSPAHISLPGNYNSARAGAPARAVGCSRSKLRFIWHLLRLGWSADRIVCGHVHLLPAVRLLSCFRPHFRYYLVAHGIEVWRRLSRAKHAAARGATRVLCVSHFSRTELLRHNPGLPADRLVVVPNALEPGWATRSTGLQTRDRKNMDPEIPATSPRLLTVARLTSVDRDKGVEDVLRALPLILASHPNAQLRIVGDGDDRARLERAAETLEAARGTGLPTRDEMNMGLETHATMGAPHSAPSAQPPHPQLPAPSAQPVLFLGSIDDASLRSEYAACDIFILPSRKEGFGLVYLEAMAFGKPCIAANAGGAPEVIGGADEPRSAGRGVRSESDSGALHLALGALRTTGVLVPFGDVAAIAAAVNELIRQPRDPVAIRAHAATFSYAAFTRRLGEALREDGPSAER